MVFEDTLLNSLIPQDFREQFFRDFKYLPYETYIVNNAYIQNDEVYYQRAVYKCLNNTSTLPTDTINWQKLNINALSYVLDDDIINAYNLAYQNFNYTLFTDDDSKKLAFLLLSAHTLYADFNSKGLPQMIISSASADGVSESYIQPNWVTTLPFYSMVSQSKYGRQYIMILESFRLQNSFLHIKGDISFN